jgi:hypothetical protein
MRRIQRFAAFITLFGLFLLSAYIAFLISSAFVSTGPSALAQQQTSSLVATPENLKYLGVAFTLVDPADKQAQGSIAKDRAMAVVLQTSPGLKNTTSNDATLGLISYPNLQQASRAGANVDTRLAGPTLVWAMVFHGIESVSMGPPGAEHHYAYDFVVVVDARTGDYLVSFPISDLVKTPLPASPSNSIITPSGSQPNVKPPQPAGTRTIAPTAVPSR